MNDASGMRDGERVGHLNRISQRIFEGQAVPGDQLVQRFAGDASGRAAR